MLQGAGITDNHTRLLYNGCQNVVSFGGAIFGAMYTDKWGRRPQLLVSTGIIVGIFCIITAINATNVYTAADGTLLAKSSIASKAEIAFIFLFGFVICAGYTPLQSLYPVEVLRYESRAKGMGLYNFWVNIASFYNTFVTGIAFTGAGWKYYFLYIFWDIFEFVFIYFFFVETKNRTLEELTEIFTAKKPVEFSLQKRTEIGIISDEKGHVVLEHVENPHSDV
jgi:MFS family permease